VARSTVAARAERDPEQEDRWLAACTDDLGEVGYAVVEGVLDAGFLADARKALYGVQVASVNVLFAIDEFTEENGGTRAWSPASTSTTGPPTSASTGPQG
jgi:ectoine hydroxylase-related dioxygenase (phytanoyl-CoA dioxygenase family)